MFPVPVPVPVPVPLSVPVPRLRLWLPFKLWFQLLLLLSCSSCTPCCTPFYCHYRMRHVNGSNYVINLLEIFLVCTFP